MKSNIFHGSDSLKDKRVNAREQNMANILALLTEKGKQEAEDMPLDRTLSSRLAGESTRDIDITPDKTKGLRGLLKKDKDIKHRRIPAHLPEPEVMEKLSIDETGKFHEPPIPDYWLLAAEDEIENQGLSNTDWRVRAVQQLREAREKLNSIVDEFYGAVIEELPEGLQKKPIPEQFKHTPVRGPRRA